MMKPTLFIFSGLPGTGKSAIAKELAKAVRATYLQIDTVEQAIRDLCDFKVEGEGYRLSHRVASDNLKLGNSVIADSCNPIRLTRKEWNEVAINSGANFVNIEIICSNKLEHKHRVKTRSTDVPNLKLPTWEQVQNREYHPWESEHIVIDTAQKTVLTAVQQLMCTLREQNNI